MLNRQLTQAASLLFLHSSWGPELKWLCNPVLSCHSCALSWFACPVGVFIQYSGNHLFPFFAFGTVFLVGVVLGRMFCGWVCPFGFLQDLLHKIPSRKFNLPQWTSSIKYFVLVISVILIPFFLGGESLYSFCRVCPASALQVTIPNLITAGFSTISVPNIVKLSALLFILSLVVIHSRAFCKTLCPIGALLAPLNFISLKTVKNFQISCISCKNCDSACPTNVRPSERINSGIPANRSLDCVVCHDCENACRKTT
jgi:ferredoxin-type protein NapH